MSLVQNIAYFQSELNATIVKQHILKADEVKYVAWSGVNLTFVADIKMLILQSSLLVQLWFIVLL